MMFINNQFKIFLFVLLFLFNGNLAFSQIHTYNINANMPDIIIDSTQLKIGGTGNNGDRISANNYYMSFNNKPIIPITGEFHFSRYPSQYWNESIKKIKAGGINMIATYVFWNMHEEHEGVFNWKGDRDLRKFIELCAKNNMKVIVRLGPFCHGEIRNGGLPDWLLSKPLAIRSNDSAYLFYVERLYDEIGTQLQGLYFKDGGPVVAAQLENEMQHSASPWGLTYPGQPYDWTAAEADLASTHAGVSVASNKNQFAEEGNRHMRILKSLAIKAGIDVPIYTATGWGFAAVIPNETLPVTGAYPYPGWTEKPEPSQFYLYKDLHATPDYSPVRYNAEDYPVFNAEIGVGIMSTYTRRPLVPQQSTDALINRFIGSGANGIGYYKYHGGSTPKGDFFFNDEAYGYPKISYDFEAPVGEYGDVRPSFQRLKLLHFFMNDFADLLAPMQTILPGNYKDIKPDDTTNLRYSVREKNGSGFLFIQNFQDHLQMPDKKNIQVNISTSKGEIKIPEAGSFNLLHDESVIFPFYLIINGATLNYATAQLLMKGNDAENPYYVFFYPEGIQPEFSFANINNINIHNDASCTVNKNTQRVLVKCSAQNIAEFTVTVKGLKTKILVIDKALALQSYIVNISNKKHLIFSDALALQTDSGLDLLSDSISNYSIKIYPKISNDIKLSDGTIASTSGNVFSAYQINLPTANIDLQMKKFGDKRFTIQLPAQMPGNVEDIFLNIDYTGDTGMGFLNGNLVTDEFYKGIPWKIGLKRFISSSNKEMSFYFRPMYKNAPYLIDLDAASIPNFTKNNSTINIKNITAFPEYKASISFSK